MVSLLPLRDSLTREMRKSLNELGILKQTKATSALSVSHQHSSAAACEGASFCKSQHLVMRYVFRDHRPSARV